VLRFAGLDAGSNSISVGAMVTTATGDALEPGADQVDARVHFWADEARLHATPGARFELWYGRIVGKGVVLSVVDDR
jgi:hypothetical protein